MEQLPLNYFGAPDKQGLLKFLEYCQKKSAAVDHPILATISLPSEYLDPLAVLQTVNDSTQEHFYMEQASQHQGVACAEPVLLFEGYGEKRFQQLKTFSDKWLAHSVFIGDESLPWSGTHFFVENTFENELKTIDFTPPTLAFVPRWQVGWKGNQFSATANVLIKCDDDLSLIFEPLWRAHQHFSAFDFSDDIEEYTHSDVTADQVEVIDSLQSERTYMSGVGDALRDIHSGLIQKVVVARSITLKSEKKFQPLQMLETLRKRYPDCYTFSFQNNKGVSLIGATPEKLIRVKEGFFGTEALAGSIKRGDNARQDAHLTKQLLGSSKDREEHGLVLNYIEEELTKLGLTVEFAKIPEVLQLSNIQHLRVPLVGKMENGVHILDLVETLHPTPALGGYPKAKALDIIAKLEQRQRSAYAGITGWFNSNNEGEMVVNIRCAKINKNEAVLYAGAGVVKDSDPANELKETELKLTSMLPVIVNMDDRQA